MSSSSLLQKWYDEVWNNGNEAFIDEMMHKDIIIHGLDPAGTSKGIAHFKTFYSNFRLSFPVTKFKVQALVSDAETAAVHISVNAKSANGKDVHFTGVSVGKFKDDKLVEKWNNFDFLKMYQQLGHILVSEISEK